MEISNEEVKKIKVLSKNVRKKYITDIIGCWS